MLTVRSIMVQNPTKPSLSCQNFTPLSCVFQQKYKYFGNLLLFARWWNYSADDVTTASSQCHNVK